MVDMGKSFTLISFLKFLLTEIEKLVLININTNTVTSAEF